MTRTQNGWLVVLSLIATVVVLVEGGSAGPDLAARVALRKPLTVTATLPKAPVGDTANVDGGAAAAASDSGAAVPTDAAVTTDAPTSTAPAEDTGGDASDGGATPTDQLTPSKIKHVFVIALAGHGFDAAFGPGSAAPYLTQQLRPQGALLTNYRSLGRADLPDYLALVGGQPPNDDTRAGCPTFKEIPPTVTPSKSGEIDGAGCVFPNTVTTLADQLSASRHTWRAYVEDLDKTGKATCRHPESNAPDDTVRARPGDGYANRHNPFVYFHSLLDLGDCDAKDGALSTFEADLASVKRTPNYSFIAPNLCNDGSESPCVDGSPGGLAAADAFLATWVPRILASPAYKQDGLLIVTFAGSVAPVTPGPTPDEPIRNGTLLVSRFAKAGSTAGADYDPYSLLRSVEDLFALRPLARAASARSFADTVLGDALAAPPSDG